MLINDENLDQIIETIRTVHRTPADQRSIDLTEYLTEFVQAIPASRFESVTRLLRDYDDRAALKIEFVQAQCFEAIHRALNENEETIVVSLDLIIELLNQSENVQERFAQFDGYEKCFAFLQYLPSPSTQLIDRCLQLIIDQSSSTDSTPSPSLINPSLTVLLIRWIPSLASPADQQRLLSAIDQIVLASLQNKTMACSNGISLALIDTLHRDLTDETIRGRILSLLEHLMRFSISVEEVRRLFQVFQKNPSCRHQLLHVLLVAAKYSDPDRQSISAYFDLQRPNSGIILPSITRWPSLTSPHFSFHAWLRLNHEVHSYPYEGHRQIYSFYSESIGLEAFISSSSLFVLIQDQQEVVYAELKDCEDLIDGYWHSLTIVHTGQRPSRFTSALTCHLSVYIDGFLRKEIADLKYVSFINESINSASVGSPSQQRRPSIAKVKTDSLSMTFAKSIQPLAGLFSSKVRKDIPRSFNQHAMTIASHGREALFGPSNSLFGQLSCIWMLAETLDERLVKHLHTMGPDFCHYSQMPVSPGGTGVSLSETIIEMLSTRSLVVYHPLACNGQVCVDVTGSPSPLHGRLINGSSLRLNSFSQSLFNIGGCSVLYPLLDFFSSSAEHPDTNPAASIIHLIHQVISSTAAMTDEFHIEVLGDYLERLPSLLIDEQFLLSVEQITESSGFLDASNALPRQLIEHILLNFSIWSRASLSIRRAHLEYLVKYIRVEKRFERDTFGVQFFLDILSEHFNPREGEADDEKPLRSIIFTIIRSFLRSEVSPKDLDAILSALSTSHDVIVSELMDVMLASMTTLGLSQSTALEQLYSLLVIPSLSGETKTKVLKLLNYLIECEQISTEARARLRLETNQIGFGGIISGLALNELNPSLVQEILQLIFTTTEGHDASLQQDHHHLNTVLTLCSAASFDVRYVAIRKLMRYFIAHPSSCRSYAKCYGWQETLAHFFVRARRSTPMASADEFLSTTIKDPRLESDESSSTDTSTPVTPTVSNGDDPLQKKLDETHESALTPDEDFIDVSELTVKSTSDASLDLCPYTSETIMTPPESKDGSREDLLSFLKSDNSKAKALVNTGGPSSVRRVSLLPDEHETMEEMCETLILAIVMILWKGIADSDEAAWMIRGQVFCALRRIHREYEFYLPLEHIERRLLELSMEACLNDVKLDGVCDGNHRQYQRYSLTSDGSEQTPTYANNSRELIKLVHDFLCQSLDDQSRITDTLVNGILPILDTMVLVKPLDTSHRSSHEDHWSETSLTGLNILLILLAHSNVSFCGQASIRIHSLLDHRSLNGREEAAYLLSTIDRVFSSISQSDDAERYAYLLPLLTIIMDEAYDLLGMKSHFPHLPSSTAIHELRQHILTTKKIDWQTFIQQLTEPFADHYRSMSIRLFQMNMRIWWNHCHEMILIGVHKRNRQIESEKMKFQNHIVRPWFQRARQNQQRQANALEDRRMRRVHLEFKWKHRKKYLDGERGPWFTEVNGPERRWMQSDRENIHRMRCRLIENDHFNVHQESSRLRDNLQIDASEVPSSNQRGNSIDGQNLSKRTRVFFTEDKQNIVVRKKCSLITAILKIDGELLVTDRNLYFFDSTTSDSCENDFKYPLSWVEDIYLRRYNLRPTGLEFFLINKRNFLLIFDERHRREIYQKLMSMKLPAMKSISSNALFTVTAGDVLKESKATERWMACEMSNFDYLMLLNTVAGRTYNDLNQYPIFPWILKDFTSNVLDLKNPNVFRDFSKPIGIQNPKHISEVKFKYESFEDSSGLVQKFHYGTHYSNAASVMHYLIRMEPFTTLHIHLQSGKFDIADRQFHSFQSSWTNILESPNDGKELIPEFFYLPEFLVNSNRFDLGKLQSNNQLLNDVELPPWANDSAEEFIQIHRIALESDFVSAHLHQWIDLVFGYKQTGQAAIDALNVFMNCSYENAFDRQSIDDSVTREAIDSMIENFGQNPAQIFIEPHPQRQTRQQATLQAESQGRPLNIFRNPHRVRAFFVDITGAEEKVFSPIVFLSMPKNQVPPFGQQGRTEPLITVNANGVMADHGWLPYDKSGKNCFTFELDPAVLSEKYRLAVKAPFSPSISVTSRLFAVSHDAYWLFSGGHWDWSLQVFAFVGMRSKYSCIHHTDVITCLALDSTGYVLVSGSRDTTCVIWHIAVKKSDMTMTLSPYLILHGHEREVTCISVSSEHDLIVSGSLDGTCNIHTVEQGTFIRTLRPTGAINDPIVNLKLSDDRYILVQTEKKDTLLYLYSINGDLIRTRKFDYRIADILFHGDNLILAVNYHPPGDHTLASSTKESAPLVASRVIIKELFELTTIRTIRLRTNIHSIFLTKDAGHLLIAVKDGRIFVLTADKKL